MADDDKIIIIKKKGGHAAHHGGAWKVAYADFVTAMMALFMVLWLMNSSKPVQDAVGGYFRDPHGVAATKGTAMGGVGAASAPKVEDMAKLKEDLIKSLEKSPDFNKIKDQIEMSMTSEGLQIELMESANGTFFEKGNAHPTVDLQDILKRLSVEAGKLPNSISIEGHTDSDPFSNSTVYGNWELSTDRANIARRLMESSGLRTGQVTQVRGFADHKLRKPLQPTDPSNRRITVIVQYAEKSTQTPYVFNGSMPPSPPAPAVDKAGDKRVEPGKSDGSGSKTK
jgi:chemotaxis protein MotB